MLRTGTNPALRTQFAEYAGYQKARASRETLDAWSYYSRRGTAKLDEPYIPGEHFGDGPVLIKPEDIEAVPYKPNTLSIFTETADPLPGKSIAEFNASYMGESPLYLSPEQKMMLRDFMVPLTFHANPNAPEVTESLLAIPDYLHANIEWQSQAIAASGGIGIGAVALSAVGLGTAAAASFKIAAGLTIPKVVFEKVGQELVERTIQQSATVFSKELGTRAIGPMLSNALGPILIGVAVFAAGFQNTGGKAIALAVFEDNLKKDCYYQPQDIDWNRASAGEQVANFAWLFKMLVLDASGMTITVPEKKADVDMQKAIETMAVTWARQHVPGKDAVYDQVLATMESRHANVNLSKGRAAKHSSTHRGAHAALAVDGNTDGNWHSGSVATTNYDQGAWWEVDLGASYAISSIKVYSRTDCCRERLQGFWIRVSQTPFTGNHGGAVFASNQPFPTNGVSAITGNEIGRYVRVYLPGSNHLSLAELEVYGSSASPDATPSETTYAPVPGYVRIQNNWYKNNYIHNQSRQLEQSPIEANWHSAQWKIVPVSDGYVRIQNRWYPDQHIHNQNRQLEVGPIQLNWHSAQWKIVPVSDGWVRIQNRWYPDLYIHNQNGKLEVGPIQLNWASALWKVE